MSISCILSKAILSKHFYLLSKATPETTESLDKGQSVIPAAIGGILSACMILVIAIAVLLIRYLLYKDTKEWNKLLCFTK